MARHGENIRKRKDGRWEGRYLWYSEEKGKWIYRSVYGQTYDEAKKNLTEEKNLIKVQENVDEDLPAGEQVSKNIMLTDVVKEWLAEVKNKNKPSTYIKYNVIYRTYLEGNFQNVPLSAVTDRLVQKKIYPSGATLGTLSESTSKSIYCVLNQALKYASRKYFVIAPHIKRPVSNERKKPVEVLTKKEQSMLLAVLYDRTDTFKMAVLLCLFTGLRLGELCDLKWSDIDFENKVIIVGRTVQRLYDQGHKTKTVLLETEPKSEFSRREIPFPHTLLELLIQFQNGREYIFGGMKPMEPRTMQLRFKRILNEAGISDKNFHILRHTFATNCVEKDTDVKSLSEILGHSDVRITLNRYVHPSLDTKRKHLETLSSFYGQIHGQTTFKNPIYTEHSTDISQI